MHELHNKKSIFLVILAVEQVQCIDIFRTTNHRVHTLYILFLSSKNRISSMPLILFYHDIRNLNLSATFKSIVQGSVDQFFDPGIYHRTIL